MNNLFIAPIKKEILVNTSQETAFRIFTENIDSWWPRTHHVGKTPMTELVLEPGINGRWYSKHEDGSEINVGKVLEWRPSARLVLAWQINGSFQYDPDIVTEVEVNFISTAPGKTKVQFEHKNLHKLGEGKAVESMDAGWGQILELYKKRVENNNP